MNAIDTTSDDERERTPAVESETETETEAEPAAEARVVRDADEAPSEDAQSEETPEVVEAAEGDDDAELPPPPERELEKLDRKKLEEQLEALKRKEAELRRALTLADHPELLESVRQLEGRAYAVARVDAKLEKGPSKAEARRREAVTKKLGALEDKRRELDTQIEQLHAELTALGADRAAQHEQDRREALEQLLVTIGEHEPTFREAGLEIAQMVPDVAKLLPEIEKLAETLVGAKTTPPAAPISEES